MSTKKPKKKPAKKRLPAKAKKPAKRGRPAFAPSQRDKDRVQLLAAIGTPEKIIAKIVGDKSNGISNNTLRKHFEHELDTAEAVANAKVAQTLFSKATAKDLTQPSVTAAIFWLKARAGWVDRSGLELHDPKGALGKLFKDAVMQPIGAAHAPPRG